MAKHAGSDRASVGRAHFKVGFSLAGCSPVSPACHLEPLGQPVGDGPPGDENMDDELQDEVGERGVMRGRPRPIAPTPAEVAEHEIDHYPRRSWCRACVAALSRSDRHLASKDDDSTIPVIGIDYGFFSDSKKEKEKSQDSDPAGGAVTSLTPILCFKDKSTKTIHADVVACKGAQDVRAVDMTVDHILRLGYPEIILRVDNEPAAKALRNAVTAKLKEKNVRVITQEPPPYDSASSGSVESSVQQIKDKTRVLVCAARELHGVVMGTTHACLPWAVQYAGQLLTRSHRDQDGFSAWQRAHGKRTLPRRYAAWGEKVWYLPHNKKKAQQTPKFEEGIFLGLKDGSEEAAIGTPTGCVYARTVRRMTKEEAGDPVLFNSVVGSPWELKPVVGAQRRITHLDVQATTDAALLPPPPPSATETKAFAPRRVYMRQAVEVKKYGPTDLCPGCTAVAVGAIGAPHSEECRRRIL